MRKVKTSSSNLFLMELILSILIFAIASSICVSFFVRSHSLSMEASTLNHAVEETTTLAECYTASSSYEEFQTNLEDVYGKAISLQDPITITLNQDFQPTDSLDGVYELHCSIHGTMAEISFHQDETTIYTLQVTNGVWKESV